MCLGLLACSSTAVDGAPPVIPGATDTPSSAPLADAGIAISETDARRLLDRMFRDAGLRVLSDVQLSLGGAAWTIDGYDPELRIGYEYLAVAELDKDLTAEERDWLRRQSSQLLILEANSAEHVERVARKFLDRYGADAGPEPSP